MTRATSLSYLHYPPPAVFLTSAHSSGNLNLATEHSLMSLPFMFLPSFARDDSRMDSQHSNRHAYISRRGAESSAPVQIQADLNTTEQYDYMEASPMVPSDSYSVTGGSELNYIPNGVESSLYEPTADAMETSEVQSEIGNQLRISTTLDSLGAVNSALLGVSTEIPSPLESVELGQPHHFIPSRDPTRWELPFLQGWLLGQSQAGIPPMLPPGGGEHSSSYSGFDPARMTSEFSNYNSDTPVASSAMPGSISLGISGRSGSGNRFPRSGLIPVSESEQGIPSLHTSHDVSDAQPIINRIQSELATSLAAAAAAAELPCTVKLRIWSHDIKNACAPLSAERCLLTVPHAVLCRYE